VIPPVLEGLRPIYRRVRGNPVPLAVYERLYGGDRYGFLYESLEEHGTRGRHSFTGGKPLVVFRSKGDRAEIRRGDEVHEVRGNPLDTLRALVRSGADALPVATFPGGAVGYLGYDVVRFLAALPDTQTDDLELPDAHFVFPAEVLIFDHVDEVVHILLYQADAGTDRLDAIAAVIAELEAVGAASAPEPEPPDAASPAPALRANITPEQFAESVRQAQEHIRAGDIYQVVLSQRFEFEVTRPPLDIYRALRRSNPSPYMYFLNLDGVQISGSSPEVLVKLTGRRVEIRPLAGTRPRGATAEEDEALARELVADEKERAEHVMLVDLARNDIGRVCQTGSVRVREYLEVERYARVMHLVSDVEGRLRDDRDAFDLFASAFPAGTVSGAPKIRAMQIIDQLEPLRRGPYAGAIGYFSFLGDMDLCIAIRTLVIHGRRGLLQVGAGVVADSVPEAEYQETLNKARALIQALAVR